MDDRERKAIEEEWQQKLQRYQPWVSSHGWRGHEAVILDQLERMNTAIVWTASRNGDR